MFPPIRLKSLFSAWDKPLPGAIQIWDATSLRIEKMAFNEGEYGDGFET